MTRPRFTLSRLHLVTLSLAVAAIAASARAEPLPPPAAPEILQELKSFATMGTVLMVAAHPDDENTQLITYLARGRGYRMGYLSVTRGDGGQNFLGGEFGPELGYIRTNELLAARNLDHGVQFFTRAIDFGFSKNPEETLRIWDQEQVLADVVRVIRTFRPDVIVTRFAPDQTNTHGHHTASAVLALAAFKIAGDPKVLPDVPVWQPKRIMLNGGAGGGRGAVGGVRIDVGGTDPVLNQTYASIAAQSRAMHKSQGLGNTGGGGGGRGPGGGNPQESFSLLGGEPATTDIMDGIDTTWGRVGKGGAEIEKLTDDVIAKFDPNDSSASLPALLEIKKLTAALASDPVVNDRRLQLDRIIAHCLGLSVESSVPNAEIVPGEELKMHLTAAIQSKMPVEWTGVTYSEVHPVPMPQQEISLRSGQASSRDAAITLSPNTPVSQPYWLRQEPAAGIFRVADAPLIGRPENPPAVPLTYMFDVGGQTLVVPDEPVQLVAGASPAQARRRLDVIAAVSLAFSSDVRVFAPGEAKSVEVEITAYRARSNGSLKLNVPAEWKVSPAAQAFSLAMVGDHATVTFTVTPPAHGAGATLSATAAIGDQTFNTTRKEISYEHLPRLVMQPPATIKAVALDLQTRGKNIGYLPGAGDSVAQCIEQMGYKVKQLKTADLTAENLKQFDAVVIGVRAFNVRDDLGANSPTLNALFDYARQGGTVVEQYNRPDGPGGTGTRTSIAPYPLHISTLRVTDENAKMTFLAPDHAVLNTPNKLTAADFENWVQERSIYLPDQVDEHFTAIFGAADPGETPPNTALLVADIGKGHWVYTTLVFFRQLPAANPGAYRLFANLVSLGKP